MEGLNRRQAAREALARSATPPPPDNSFAARESEQLAETGLSLQEIRTDPREHELFFDKHLMQVNRSAAVQIIEKMEGKQILNPTQIRFLEQARESFNKQRAYSELIKKELPEHIEKMAAFDPRIKEAMGMIGREEAIGFFSREIEELAMTDPRALERMVQHMRNKDTIEKRARELDTRIAEELQHAGLTEEEYVSATSAGSAVEIEQNLRASIRKDLGIFRGIWDSMTGESAGRAKHLRANFEAEKQIPRDLDAQTAHIGRVLRTTITPKKRLAMQEFMHSGKPLDSRPPGQVFNFDTMRNIRHQLGDAAIKARFNAALERKKQALGVGRGLSAIEVDEVEREFVPDEFGRQRSMLRDAGRGTFASFLRYIFHTQRQDEIRRIIQTP